MSPLRTLFVMHGLQTGRAFRATETVIKLDPLLSSGSYRTCVHNARQIVRAKRLLNISPRAFIEHYEQTSLTEDINCVALNAADFGDVLYIYEPRKSERS